MKKHLFVLSMSAAICVGGLSFLSACKTEEQKEPPIVTPQEEKLEFEKAEYVIKSGTAIKVKGDVSGVTYAFQGGTPEGVTLDTATGVITFDEHNDKLNGTYVYIATKGDETATTKVKFSIVEIVPIVTFLNVSNYIVNNELISASAISESGKEFAVTYGLKNQVEGISIDETTGKVTFSTKLENNTKFIVTATANKIVEEKEFIAMTSGFITSETPTQILEKGTEEVAKFLFNFNGNTEAEKETTAEKIKIAIDNKIIETKDGYFYDATTKTLSINNKMLKEYGSGEMDIKVITPRNAVKLSLAVADKFIYTGEDFNNIFAPDFGQGTPTFKEGSLDGYYVLGADIDLTSYLAEGGAGYNDGKGWKPIGAYEDGVYAIPFTGTFDGLGHTISGFNMGKVTSVNGFFGHNNGTIKNFTLKGNVKVNSWSSALVGNNGEKGLIENVIVDIPFINEGHSATGTIASVNHGTIRNVLSINEKVQGYNTSYSNWDPESKPWTQSGILVGLNETTGVVENAYGISRRKETETKKGVDKVFGSSNNKEVTEETAGKVFGSLDEMKAYDFSKLPGDIFDIKEGEIPTLKTIYEPLSAGYLSFVDMPQFALKRDIIELNVKILPEKYAEELKSQIKYEFTGLEGVKIAAETNTLDFSEAKFSPEGNDLTIKATLEVDGKVLSDTCVIKVFENINSLSVAPIESITAGETITLEAISLPQIEAKDVSWKIQNIAATSYCELVGNKLTLKENVQGYIKTINVIASAFGLDSEPFEIPVVHMNKLANNNVVHYEGEEALSYDYTLPETTSKITKVVVNGKEFKNEKDYKFEAGILKIDPKLINAVPGTQIPVRIITENADNSVGNYMGYAGISESAKRDEAWINNAFGKDAYTKITTKEQFMDIFYNSNPEQLKVNLARDKVYMLEADIDLAGEKLSPIGIPGDENNEVNFNGQLYGNGHSIKNLTMKSNEAGLFRKIEGQIYDLTLDGFNLSTEAPSGYLVVGALAVYGGGNAKVENVNIVNTSLTAGEAIPEAPQGFNISGMFGRNWSKNIKFSTYNGFNTNLYK